MEVRCAKNICIILLNKQELQFETKDMLKDISYLRTKMDLVNTEIDILYSILAKIRRDSYKVHIYVDGDNGKSYDKYPFILERILDILSGKKVYIHCFNNCPLFPNSDTLWGQEFSVNDSEFLSVRKIKDKLAVFLYRREEKK